MGVRVVRWERANEPSGIEAMMGLILPLQRITMGMAQGKRTILARSLSGRIVTDLLHHLGDVVIQAEHVAVARRRTGIVTPHLHATLQ